MKVETCLVSYVCVKVEPAVILTLQGVGKKYDPPPLGSAISLKFRGILGGTVAARAALPKWALVPLEIIRVVALDIHLCALLIK